MEEVKLKPCPFCGNKQPELVHVTWATPNSYLVRCQSCGATSSGGGANNGFNSFYSHTKAIESWNMRAAKDVLTELQIMRQDIAWIRDFLIKQTIGALPYATWEQVAQKAREGVVIGGGS